MTNPATRPVASIAIALAMGCASAPTVQTLQARMHANFQGALGIRAAALFGDLERMNESAESLLNVLQSDSRTIDAEAEEHALRATAARAAYTRRPEELTVLAAEVARRCGDCHTKTGASIGQRFVVGGAVTDGGVPRHMARNSWVSRLLWDGLVGPSDRTWTAGAEALIASPEFPEAMSDLVDRRRLEDVQARWIELGREAVAATDPAERVQLLGQVWQVCADCHTDVGVR